MNITLIKWLIFSLLSKGTYVIISLCHRFFDEESMCEISFLRPYLPLSEVEIGDGAISGSGEETSRGALIGISVEKRWDEVGIVVKWEKRFSLTDVPQLKMGRVKHKLNGQLPMVKKTFWSWALKLILTSLLCMSKSLDNNHLQIERANSSTIVKYFNRRLLTLITPASSPEANNDSERTQMA